MIHLQTTTVNNVPASKDMKSKDYNSHFGHAVQSSLPLYSKDMYFDSLIKSNEFKKYNLYTGGTFSG